MIVGILELNSSITYGRSSRNITKYLFRPFDKTLGLCIVGCSRIDRTSNILALITVENWEKTKLSNGILVEIIGNCGDKIAEENALLYHYAIRPWKKFKEIINIPEFKDDNFISGYSFNVDPEGCLDIDDTILLGEDGYIYIVIADVYSWINNNEKCFELASKIGQTLYKDGKVIAPLLPFQEEVSLLPGKKRRGIALKFKWNNEITDISFTKITFINNESFTYESIYKSKFSNLLKDITSYLAQKNIIDSHEWIEQLMIFYNCEAAKILLRKQKGYLREQESPDKIETFKKYGVDLEILSNKSAKYVVPSKDAMHYGLQKLYCHATSPIRRFVDIINQMNLVEDKEFDCDINILNKRSTQSKKYERDLFFLRKIMEPIRITYGTVLTDHRIWIPEWKKIITCKNTSNVGTYGKVIYSVDMNQSSWKSRLVFRFEDINYQE